MKSNKQFIDEIYEKYNEYNKEKQNNKQVYMRKIIDMAAVVIVIFSSLIIFSKDKVQKNNSIIEESNENIFEFSAIKPVDNFENLYNILKKQTTSNVIESFDSTILKSENNISLAETANQYSSETNTQVKNVDESDIVKVYKNYIYYITSEKVVIIDATNVEKSDKIAEINYEEDEFYPKEIYVKNNKLIVVGSENLSYTAECKTFSEDIEDISYNNFNTSKTGIIIYDISNINDPKEIRRVMVQGNYISSRMIENNIYFVANQYINTIQIRLNEIKDLNEDNYKIKYEDTVINQEEKNIGFDKIYNLEDSEDTSYLILAGLNIENEEEVDIKTFLGAGQYVYSSEKNMYIATNKIKYGEGYEILRNTTNILKFELNNGKIKYKAETEIEGQVNNQFSMDENEEYFRIATTSGKLWNMDENTSNNLYILNDRLEEVGKVTGFAKSEKIYSVRYIGDKAYVVTVKETDPLFVIDLSNITNPQILGELKLPGYSTYLHPYDETHIIGFGYETKENGTRIINDGLKMVMFDVSDLTNPKVLFKIKVGNNKYTYSELLYNHKALLFSKEKNIIAFPLYSSEGSKSYSRAAVYEIDLEKGFSLKGEIGEVTSEYKRHVERIVIVNDTFYTLSKGIIKVANMNTCEIIKEIEL